MTTNCFFNNTESNSISEYNNQLRKNKLKSELNILEYNIKKLELIEKFNKYDTNSKQLFGLLIKNMNIIDYSVNNTVIDTYKFTYIKKLCIDLDDVIIDYYYASTSCGKHSKYKIIKINVMIDDDEKYLINRDLSHPDYNNIELNAELLIYIGKKWNISVDHREISNFIHFLFN